MLLVPGFWLLASFLDQMPALSVVIPTYNRAASLERALQSIDSQTYKDLEMIVVDDGSEDDTQAIVRQYKACRYVRIPHSGLPAVVRNVGIRIADAGLVAFLDSDDEWLPDKLETQVRIMNAGRYGLACSNAFVGAVPYLRPEQGRTGKVLKDLLADNFVITSTVVVRRDVLKRTGGFCEDPVLRGLEDYDLWLRITASSEVCYVPEELAFYQRSMWSLSQERSELSYLQGMALILSRVATTADSEDRSVMTELKRRMDGCRRATCNAYLAQHRFRDFAKTFLGFCAHRPLSAAKYLVVNATRRHEDPSHG